MIFLEDIIQKRRLDKTLINCDSAIIEDIKRLLFCGTLSEGQIIKELSNNLNIVNSNLLKRFLDEGILSFDTISKIVGNDKIIKAILDDEEYIQMKPYPKKLKKLSSDDTNECFFWGTEFSGKSTVLGMLMSYINTQYAIENNINCQGYVMMSIYSSLYKTEKICRFMPGNICTAFEEMTFRIVNSQKSYTFVETPGLIARAVYQNYTQAIRSRDADDMMENLLSLFENHNKRRTHIICLPNHHLRIEWNGIPLSVYMDTLLHFLINNKIIKTDDSVLLLSTIEDENVTFDNALLHLKENYSSFYNLIKSKSEEIIFDLKVLPFSVGKVFFQDFCIPDFALTKDIADYIIEKGKLKESKSIISKLFAWLGN